MILLAVWVIITMNLRGFLGKIGLKVVSFVGADHPCRS